jgi:cytochrome c553
MSHRPSRIAVLAASLLAMAAAPAAPAPDAAAIFLHGTPQGVPACATCHGPQGLGNAALGAPLLAGSPQAYLASQLADLAAGRRANALMAPIAKELSAAQQASLASYLSALPPPAIKAPARPNALGETLALDGRDAGRLPACVSCHGPQGMGVGDTFPPLAGQPAGYIEAQLHAWQDGKRPPGPLGLMPAIAKRLSDGEITAVAEYFASLTPAPEAK